MDTAAAGLPSITVTGQINRPAGASIVVGDLAAKRANTSDTASLLGDIPGAAVYGGGGVSGLPVLDGLADDRLSIDVGGFEILAACANHMNPPLSYIDPSHVAEIRVFSGLVPVSVGGDSIGGAIEVSPPDPVFAKPGQGVLKTGEIGAFYRSNGNAYGGNVSATLATENVSITYSGSYARSDNYTAGGDFKPAGPAFSAIPGVPVSVPVLSGSEVGSTAYESQNHDLAIAVRHENHLVQLDLGYQHIPYQGYPNQRMDMTKNKSFRAKLKYTGHYDWGVLEAQVTHQAVRHEMNFGDDKQFYYGSPTAVLAPGMPMDTRGFNTEAKLKASIGLAPGQILRVGAEYQRYRYNEWWPPSPAVLPAGVMMSGMAPNTFLTIHDGKRDRADAYVEWEARWSPEWVTQVGARSDTVMMNTGPVHGYNPMMYDPAPIYPATTFNAADRSRTDQNWDVTALATYTPDKTQSYTFGFSQKSRSPNLYERYTWSTARMAMEMIGWFGDGNFYVGNLDLKPEVARTVSATADWHRADGTAGLKITPYLTYVTDYIDAHRCPTSVCGSSAAVVSSLTSTQGFVYLQFVNQDARLYGIDVSAHALLAKDTPVGSLTAKGILSYVNGRNTTAHDNLYNMMPVNGKVILEQSIGQWTGSIETELVGAKADVSQVRNEVKTGAYALLNLKGSYEWGNLRVDLGVENALDTLYSLPLGGAYLGQGMTMASTAIPWGIPVPGMGRSFYVATSVKF